MLLRKSFAFANRTRSPDIDLVGWYQTEWNRDQSYPISRYLWRPLARWSAIRLAYTAVTPSQVTSMNLLFTLLSAMSLVLLPQLPWLAGIGVLLAWFADRLDGCLARLTQSSSEWGAWFDANIDEFSDVLWHLALGYASTQLLQSQWPWVFVVGFLAGKYLFFYSMHGVTGEQRPSAASPSSAKVSVGKQVYHLPGNADVRIHLLASCLLLAAWFPSVLVLEIALVAVYYNLRWILRYPLMYSRLKGQ